MENLILEEEKQIQKWLEEAKQSNKVLALLVVGDSCSGKTMRLNLLANRYGLSKIITSTTRPIRPKEKQDIDYHFLSEQNFIDKKNKGEFLEFTNYGFNYYGTENKEFLNCINLNKNCYLILDINGIMNVKNILELKHEKEFLIKTIYYKINKETFLKRIALRDKGQDKEYINNRLIENESANLTIKNNPKLVDLTIDTSKEIEAFKEKEIIENENKII